VCYWSISLNYGAKGTSFFGNSSGIYYTDSDLDAGDYIVPTFTFAGGGGQDVITFEEYGIYILIFSINISYPGTSINSADISNSAILVGCDCLGSTHNSGSLDPVGYVYCLGTFQSLYGGTITFPDQTSLLTLYGSGWLGGLCDNVSVIRLS